MEVTTSDDVVVCYHICDNLWWTWCKNILNQGVNWLLPCWDSQCIHWIGWLTMSVENSRCWFWVGKNSLYKCHVTYTQSFQSWSLNYFSFCFLYFVAVMGLAWKSNWCGNADKNIIVSAFLHFPCWSILLAYQSLGNLVFTDLLTKKKTLKHGSLETCVHFSGNLSAGSCQVIHR